MDGDGSLRRGRRERRSRNRGVGSKHEVNCLLVKERQTIEEKEESESLAEMTHIVKF